MESSSLRKNVVLLTDCLKDLEGGAERQIFELARRLDKEKYAVTIASLECGSAAPRERIEAAGCRLLTFPVKRIYGPEGLVQGFRFVRFLKANRVRILVTYHFSSDIWGAVTGKLAGVETIISNRRDLGFWRNNKHVRAYKAVNAWVRKIVVVSQAVKDVVIKEEDVPETRIEVIYNGIELIDTRHKAQETSREALGLKDDDIVIMHVANLRPVKGHEYLLRAFETVTKSSRRIPNDQWKSGPRLQSDPEASGQGHTTQVKLVLIGEDELGGSLQELAGQLGIKDKVLFLGKKKNAREYLSLADICTLPSLSEGMPNAALEYMAAGKPVVATRVGGTAEVVTHGVSGLLVSPQNVEELAAALGELVNDREKRVSFGNAGLADVQKRFAMGHMVACYEKLFDQYVDFDKPRVLHLVSSIGLFGAERVILTLAQHNAKVISIVGALNNRHNPHLEVVDEARRNGLETFIFDSFGPFDPFTIGRLRRYLKETRVDILHTHNYKSDIIGFLATCGLHCRWVATNHVWHGRDEKLKVYEAIDALILRFAERVFTVSAAIKDDLVSRRISPERVRVIDNCIDLEKFKIDFDREGFRQSLGIEENEVVLLIAGRLDEEKGHTVLLRALTQVRDAGPWKLLIVGDGPLRDNLKEQAAAAGLSERVVFTGIRRDMPQVYAASDIMVNASFIEGLPMTILEAMASRLCIIATTVGAVPKVIQDGISGVLLKPGDVEGLSQAVLRLIQDAGQRQQLARQAYQDVCQEFSADRMSEQYFENYREVLGC